jgi:hypothetical protein
MVEGRLGRPPLAAKREQFARLIARGVGIEPAVESPDVAARSRPPLFKAMRARTLSSSLS